MSNSSVSIKSASSVFEGDIIRLRPLRLEDKERSTAWRNDPQVRDRQLGYRFPVTEEMEADWIDKVLRDRSGTRCILAIEEKDSGDFIGFIHLQDIDWINGVSELGISIGDKKKHNKGFAGEAVALILAHAFNVFNLRRVWVRVVAFNAPALQLFESSGFVKEGVLRQHIFLDGRPHDLVLMGILNTEFIPQKKS